jgi:hypothetical protein
MITNIYNEINTTRGIPWIFESLLQIYNRRNVYVHIGNINKLAVVNVFLGFIASGDSIIIYQWINNFSTDSLEISCGVLIKLEAVA